MIVRGQPRGVQIRNGSQMSSSPNYYKNVNTDLMEICPKANSVIEFGCGEGQFLDVYKSNNLAATCVGFELSEAAAGVAETRLDKVLKGNAEQLSLSTFGYEKQSFDLFIYGDVIEHFVDPWATLKAHMDYLKPGGHICACIPNISNWTIIFSLLHGEFEYQNSGLLDRTHLRFFTKKSITEMVQDLDLEVEILASRNFQIIDTDKALVELAKFFDEPVEAISPERIEDWSTFQYLLKARKPMAATN